MSSPLKLYPDQQVAFQTILNRYSNGGIQKNQLLPAETGYGKTVLATKVAHVMHYEKGMDIIVICPPTLRNHWRKSMKEENVPIKDLFSYNDIRGMKGKVIGKNELDEDIRNPAKVKHPYLTRGNEKTGPFEVTEAFETICKDGLFIIFDESQALKNKTSATHWACFELIKTAMKYNGYVIHLTATSIDKDDNWQCIFRNMGIITKRELLKYNPGNHGGEKYSWKEYGLGTMYTVAKQINESKINEIISSYEIKTRNIPELLKEIWLELFRDLVVVRVDDPVYKNSEGVPYLRTRQNGFYTLDTKGAILAEKAINELKRAHIITNDNQINVNKANKSMGLIQKSLMLLSEAKVDTIYRIARKDLDNLHNCKVILCIPFKDDQYSLKESLKKYNPLQLNGDVPFDRREAIIDRFNEPNSKFRVLIMTPQVGGVGVSLHDTDGRFPRRMYITPTFHFLDMIQASGRTYRRNLKSNVFISFVYGNNTSVESIFINTMIKSRVAGSVMIPNGRIFPENYEEFREDTFTGVMNIIRYLLKKESYNSIDLTKLFHNVENDQLEENKDLIVSIFTNNVKGWDNNAIPELV